MHISLMQIRDAYLLVSGCVAGMCANCIRAVELAISTSLTTKNKPVLLDLQKLVMGILKQVLLLRMQSAF